MYPAARVLYISGYTENIALQQGLVDAWSSFLPKPFTGATLTSRVRELLDQRIQSAV